MRRLSLGAPGPDDPLGTAKRALDEGDTARALAATRAALAETPWSVALLTAAGELLARMAARPAGDVVERLAVVGTCTTGVLVPALRCALAEEGRLAAIYEGPFGALDQEILDGSSGLHAFDPHTVLIVRSWRELSDRLPQPGDSPERVDAMVEREVARFEELWSRLRSGRRRRILQHDLEPPEASFVGAAEETHPASGAGFVSRLNARLRQAAAGRVAWVGVAAAARRVGSERWSPADLWALGRLPLSAAQLVPYARLVQGAWRVAAHLTRKVLVTDLDNTLWGGVLGDDGLDGIVLGPGSPAGEGFQDFARYLVQLQRRGVVLAVCSRNDPEGAVRPFREHPQMPLREEDFAVFHCSWDDKVSGLREIARRLNLGTDALVLVDDNPAECAFVRRELPEVTAVHLTGPSTTFAWQLESRHLFDREALTREDLERGRAYRTASEGERLRASAADVESFLEELRMEGRLWIAAPSDMERLAQLEAKTNQFNTTTPRFSKGDLEAFAAAPDHEVLAFRLRDRFTDHGTVSCLVLRVSRERLAVASWTLSCRVFSRGAEAFIRNGLLALCRLRKLRGIEGLYRPTPRNGVVAELFPRLGFSPEGEGRWFLPADAPELSCHIRDAAS